MENQKGNFKAWYSEVLASLYPSRDAGFVILMVTFPLLERYLRQKLGLSPQASLQDSFYVELSNLFPQLTDKDIAKNFWQVYRKERVRGSRLK